MSEKHGINRFTSRGDRQAGKQGARRTLVRRFLLIWLAALTVVMAASAAGAFAAPSDEDATGSGSSLEGATSNPGQDSVTARASPNGDGAFSAWFTDPGEWYVGSPAPAASTPDWQSAAGAFSAWFTDPGEWYVGSPATVASTQGFPEAAGSYSALRLAAAGAGAEMAGASHLSDAAGAYGELRLAAGEKGAATASAWQEEYEWLVAQDGFLGSGSATLSESSLASLSNVCAELSDDPVFGASSPAEAEFYESQCSAQAAAVLLDYGGMQ